MFFVLSKILHFLVSPLTWIIVVFVISFFVHAERKAKILRITAMVMLLFFSNPFIVGSVMSLWEPDVRKMSGDSCSYDYGLVLTGMLSYDAAHDRIGFGRSSDRIWQALDLYHQGVIKKIVIIGGSGEIFNQEHPEAAVLSSYLVRNGMPADDIIVECKSRNTYENAVEAASLLRPLERRQSYLLITSAIHMRRAAACFKKQGFDFDIYPTDYLSANRRYTPDALLVPSAAAMHLWFALNHEIAGIVAYWLCNKI